MPEHFNIPFHATNAFIKASRSLDLKLPTQIHLIMPFGRPHLKEILLREYEPMGVILHPIFLPGETVCFEETDWVQPFVCGKGNTEIVGRDFYIVMPDDDMIEPGVCDKVREMEDDIIVVSMKRGDNVPDVSTNVSGACPTHTLYAHPSCMRPCGVGIEQLFIRGFIFKTLYLDETNLWGDGELASKLVNRYPVRYEPELYVRFNYYEPGRWDENA
jgi:hypothetical protein